MTVEKNVEMSKKQGGAQKEQGFRCPCVPLIPCLGIYANFLLCCLGVEYQQWMIFLLFEIVGVLFYLMYGYKNSHMPERMRRHMEKKRRNHSAYTVL